MRSAFFPFIIPRLFVAVGWRHRHTVDAQRFAGNKQATPCVAELCAVAFCEEGWSDARHAHHGAAPSSRVGYESMKEIKMV